MSAFNISAALLDALVLSVTEDSDCYGYQITKDIQQHVSVSESTLYPVLRRLQKNGLLDVYDMPYMGRNRRYYRITQNGRNVLFQYRIDWKSYVDSIDGLLNKSKELTEQ